MVLIIRIIGSLINASITFRVEAPHIPTGLTSGLAELVARFELEQNPMSTREQSCS